MGTIYIGISFVGIPLITGLLSKKFIAKRKGIEWFEEKYKPIVSRISILALLTTPVYCSPLMEM
jgi:ACR3 family arsenite transporter